MVKVVIGESANRQFSIVDPVNPQNKLQVTSSGALLTTGIPTTTILPSADATYDLGSATDRWRDMYLSGKVHGGGTFNLLETVAITTPGNPIAVTGLNGDTDGIYSVVATLTKDATPGHLYLLFNGDIGADYDWTNVDSDVGGGGPIAASSDAGILLGGLNNSDNAVAANGVMQVELMVWARSGVKRKVSGRTVYDRAAGGMGAQLVAGQWQDTTHGVTEIDFKAGLESSPGNLTGVISIFKLVT